MNMKLTLTGVFKLKLVRRFLPVIYRQVIFLLRCIFLAICLINDFVKKQGNTL